MKIKISKETAITIAALSAVILLGHVAPVLAASDADWANNTSGGIDKLTAILITIASSVVGLAIVGFGLSVCMSGGHIDWRKLGGFLFAGILIGVGPAAMAWWVAYNQTGGN